MLSTDEMRVLENATVFYPVVKSIITGNVFPNLVATRTLLKDGRVLACYFNVSTKNLYTYIEFNFRSKGWNKHEPQSLEQFVHSHGGAVGWDVWHMMAERISFESGRMGTFVFVSEKKRIYENEYVKYLHCQQTELAEKKRLSEKRFSEKKHRRPASVKELVQTVGSSPFAPYFLFEFRTGRTFTGNAVDKGDFFLMNDGRMFEKKDYIGKPLDKMDEC